MIFCNISSSACCLMLFVSLEVHLQAVFFQRCQAITHKTRKLGWLLEAIDSKSGHVGRLIFVQLWITKDAYSEGLTMVNVVPFARAWEAKVLLAQQRLSSIMARCVRPSCFARSEMRV